MVQEELVDPLEHLQALVQVEVQELVLALVVQDRLERQAHLVRVDLMVETDLQVRLDQVEVQQLQVEMVQGEHQVLQVLVEAQLLAEAVGHLHLLVVLVLVV